MDRQVLIVPVGVFVQTSILQYNETHTCINYLTDTVNDLHMFIYIQKD